MNWLLHITDRPSELLAILSIFIAAKTISSSIPRFLGLFFFLIVVTVFLAGIPLVIILLVSNGKIDILNLRWVGGWADRLALVCDFLIPCFLIFLPQLLRRKLPWENLKKNDPGNLPALLPTWLAFYSGMATAFLIFSLHFIKRGQLAHLKPAVVCAACVGIVTILMPFYSLLARACWQCDFKIAFNPVRWLQKQWQIWCVICAILRTPKPNAVPGPAEVHAPAVDDGGTQAQVVPVPAENGAPAEAE